MSCIFVCPGRKITRAEGCVIRRGQHEPESVTYHVQDVEFKLFYINNHTFVLVQ